MSNGRKRRFATFASAILLAASALAATPAAAQTGGGSGDDGRNDPYCCNVSGCGYGYLYGSGYGYDCCYNDGYGWYSLHAWGTDACYIAPPDETEPDTSDGRSWSI